jgi:hypothetical protein
MDDTNTGDPNSTKKALCIGINDYPGTQNDLQGCVNDCDEWSKILQQKFGFGYVRRIVNSGATIANVKAAMSKLISSAKAGDILAITYSGHGSSVADYNGDEPDGRDETLYLYDGNLVDDDIKAILSGIPAAVNLTIICDSCHSGTVTRLTAEEMAQGPKPRYMPPVDVHEATIMSSLPVKGRAFSEDDMKEILLAGCKNTEYSYDASFDKPMGAFSYYATQILWQETGLTYEQFYQKLMGKLPNQQYPQTPQLEGRNKTRVMFS